MQSSDAQDHNLLSGLDCVYHPELSEDLGELRVEGEELQHLRALRLRQGQHVAVTNGQGLLAQCRLAINEKKFSLLAVEQIFRDLGEPQRQISLALGILENKDRFEFALEKCTELGITDFFPLEAEYSQRRTVSPSRLESKAIAAIKQCKRSRLPRIHPPRKLQDILSLEHFSSVVTGDAAGQHPLQTGLESGTVLVVIGPEGGLSPEEIKKVRSDERTLLWNLGNRRLRAETAAIAATAIAALL